MLLAGLFQYWASAQAAAFHWRHPLSSHNLLVFWGVPYFLHVLVRVADLARPETPRAAGAEADYSDDGPARPAVAAAGLDVTPPRVRRT